MYFSKKQTGYSLSSDDDFNTIKNHLDRKLEVLQLQLNESYRSFREQLEAQSYTKYTKLETSVYNVINTTTTAVSKQEQLQITVDYLLKDNQSSIEKYEMLKTYIDWLSPNNTSANKQKNNTVDVVSQAIITEDTKTRNDDINKEQEIMKQILNVLVEGSASPEKFCQLETLVDTLAENSVSRDYMDAKLKDQAKDRLKKLQRISAAIKDIDTKNCTLEMKNTELQVFVKGLKKSNRNKLDVIDEEIKRQQIIMKVMRDENNTHKMKFEKMLTEATENLNSNIVQIIHNLLAEQMP